MMKATIALYNSDDGVVAMARLRAHIADYKERLSQPTSPPKLALSISGFLKITGDNLDLKVDIFKSTVDVQYKAVADRVFNRLVTLVKETTANQSTKSIELFPCTIIVVGGMARSNV